MILICILHKILPLLNKTKNSHPKLEKNRNPQIAFQDRDFDCK